MILCLESRKDLLKSEDVLAAVLVVADEFFALTGAGDGEGILMLVGNAASALVAFHGDVTPDAAIGSVARDIKNLLFLGFFANGLSGSRCGFRSRLFYHHFGFGFGLRFERNGVVNGFGRGLRTVASNK